MAKPNTKHGVEVVGEGWIGVGLDGTLAHYDTWRGHHYIGAPVTKMVLRVKQYLELGYDMRIFTARVCPQQPTSDIFLAQVTITRWSLEHIGKALPITCVKDWACIELWDDRAHLVIVNTGEMPTKDQKGA